MDEKFKQAALLFGKDGSAGESDAIANYCMLLTTITDEKVRANIIERIGDELNHLLGDTLDAINIAGLKITDDGLGDILEGLKAASETPIKCVCKCADKENAQETNEPEIKQELEEGPGEPTEPVEATTRGTLDL